MSRVWFPLRRSGFPFRCCDGGGRSVVHPAMMSLLMRKDAREPIARKRPRRGAPTRRWRRLVPWLMFAAAAPALGGCAFFSFLPFVDGPERAESDEKKKKKADKPAELVDFEAEAVVHRLWRVKVGRGLGRKYLRLMPVVVADRVFAADGYGHVVAVERFTGKPVWQARIGETDKSGLRFWDRRDPSFVTGGVGAGEGRVLLGTTRGEIIALDVGAGDELWRAQVSAEVLSPPVAWEDIVVAQTADDRLIALEAADGAQRWAYDSQVPLLTLRGTATPLVEDGFVFAGFGDGHLTAVDAASGAPLWNHRVMLPQGRTELDRLVDVDGTPLFAAGLLFTASYQGKLKALRPADGTVVWELPASTHLNLAEGYGHIYLVDDDVVLAIGQRDAGVVWRQDALKNRGLTSPTAFGNYVLVGDAEGYLHVLAQSDGRFVARAKLGKGLRTPLVEVDGAVYAISDDGRLTAMEIRRRG